jgi:hypothetical protein
MIDKEFHSSHDGSVEEKLEGDIGSQDVGHQGCVNPTASFRPTVGMIMMD